MSKHFNRFSRFIAIILVLTFGYMSCVNPFDPPPQETQPSPLTPGVGTPSYFYLDSDGNYIESEASGHGRTGLVVEGNKFAEGVLVYSDDIGPEDRVAFVYEDSIVSMFFKKGSNFPNRMAISNGSEEYYAYVSSYNIVNHTYHITFLSDNNYDMMDNVILNGNIFSLYEDDPELTDSQNRRMANMIIAMGVWGSLYATFDKQNSVSPPYVFRGVFSNFFKGVASVFTTVAFVAVIVATVVAPIVSFINPVAGLALAGFAWGIAEISIKIASVAISLAYLFEKLEEKPIVSPLPIIPYALVSRIAQDGNEIRIKYNDNENHEEFHIPPGADLTFKFYIPYYNTENMDWKSMVWYDEPNIGKTGGVPDAVLDLNLFTSFPPELIKSSEDKDVFFVKFKRINYERYGDKINFCFLFNFTDKEKNPLDLTVNDYTGGFYFRLQEEDIVPNEPHKNMVVIHFCMKENCPDAQ